MDNVDNIILATYIDSQYLLDNILYQASRSRSYVRNMKRRKSKREFFTVVDLVPYSNEHYYKTDADKTKKSEIEVENINSFKEKKQEESKNKQLRREEEKIINARELRATEEWRNIKHYNTATVEEFSALIDSAYSFSKEVFKYFL